MSAVCPLLVQIANAEPILWHRWQHFQATIVTHDTAMARYHTLERSLLASTCLPMLLERAGNHVVELREAVVRAHRSFAQDLAILEALYAQHIECACQRPHE